MGCGGSRIGPKPDKASAKSRPPSFAALIAAGTVVPDEHRGPYALGSYHANVTGYHRGYKSLAGKNEWVATNKAIMARQTSWYTIDFEAEDAVDPEYMFDYGLIGGDRFFDIQEALNMSQLRPTVIKAQAAMKEGYGAAFEEARGKPGAAEVYERIAALPEKIGKVRQPGGEQLDLIGLYKGALGAVGELWQYGQQTRVGSGEAGVAASWGLKKACRIWFKLHTKYGGDVSKVTDCARISLEFATAKGLERAATFVLQAASTFKNRVANPTDEGYRDLMFTVLIGGHVCEVQLHLVEMIKAKKSGAGHKMYKVCRRVLIGPIVAKDTYCLEVVGKELRGEGQRVRDGRGTLVSASGDMYEGQWQAGMRDGQGKWTSCTGDVYEGGYAEDLFHGDGKYSFAGGDVFEGFWYYGNKSGYGKLTEAHGGVFEGHWTVGMKDGIGKQTSADGSSYDGNYKNGEVHGSGTYTYADGNVYEGEWEKGKQHGRGKMTFASGNSYDGKFKNGQKHGSGTYTYNTGAVEVGCYKADAEVGQGVKWSADRAEAWELQAGAVGRSIPLDEAAKIAERIGLPLPPSALSIAARAFCLK